MPASVAPDYVDPGYDGTDCKTLTLPPALSLARTLTRGLTPTLTLPLTLTLARTRTLTLALALALTLTLTLIYRPRADRRRTSAGRSSVAE